MERFCEDCGEPSPNDERRLRCPWCKKLVCPWCRHHVHNGEHVKVNGKRKTLALVAAEINALPPPSPAPAPDPREAATKAARALVARLDEVHEHPAYRAVWTIAQMHLGPYDGPTYVDALAALRTALDAPSPAPRDETPVEWVIEDTRNPIGDHAAWFWGPNRNGYTNDITKAGRYSREEAEKQARSRSTDIAHRLADVIALARPTVDRNRLREVAPRDEGKEPGPATTKEPR